MVAESQDTVLFDSRWRTSDVVGLAQAIREEKAYHRTWMLSDGLMDAGCEDETLIAQCRSGDHEQAEWIVALILVYDLWHQVYNAMGMEKEFNSQIQRLSLTCQSDQIPVPVIKGVTPNKVVKALRKLGVNVYSYYDDIDREVTENDRDPKNGSYAVCLRATVEPDEENKNQSANERRQKGCKDVTLLECLLQELFYFMATGKHLSIKNWTQATGSRSADGLVPRVRWSAGPRRLDVRWDDIGFRHDLLRARSVVSLATEPSEAQAE